VSVEGQWVIIVLEENNEERGLTHIISDEAIRYPKPYDGDLYVVGYDVNGNLQFLLAEQNDNDEVLIRVVEDEELYGKLLGYYKNPNRLPSTEEDGRILRKLGSNYSKSISEKQIYEKMAELPISRF